MDGRRRGRRKERGVDNGWVMGVWGCRTSGEMGGWTGGSTDRQPVVGGWVDEWTESGVGRGHGVRRRGWLGIFTLF